MCKARLVARGDMQRDVPDDPYSPTCRFETLRAFCSFAAQFDLEITDFDVQNAYLQCLPGRDLHSPTARTTTGDGRQEVRLPSSQKPLRRQA